MKLEKNLSMLAHRSSSWFKRSSPTILCVVAAIGVVGTAVAAALATKPALDAVDEYEEENGPLTTPEKVLMMAPSYIPAATIAVGTMVCIFGANALNKRQQAMIVSAYGLLDRGYKEYKDKVLEMLGKDGELEIRDAIVKDHIKENPPEDTDTELPLFYDIFSKQYFNLSMEDFIDANYKLNRNFALRGYSSLEEFYAFLGLDSTELSEIVGWDYETLIEEYGVAWIDIGARLVKTDDGLECYVIDYFQEPKMDDELYPGIREQIDPAYKPIDFSDSPREFNNAHYERR